jgi:hypothetical protein
MAVLAQGMNIYVRMVAMQMSAKSLDLFLVIVLVYVFNKYGRWGGGVARGGDWGAKIGSIHCSSQPSL